MKYDYFFCDILKNAVFSAIIILHRPLFIYLSLLEAKLQEQIGNRNKIGQILKSGKYPLSDVFLNAERRISITDLFPHSLIQISRHSHPDFGTYQRLFPKLNNTRIRF